MNKSIYWFINDVVVKKGIIIITFFIPFVNQQVPYKIRKLVGIVQTSGKKDEKNYLLFTFEITDVNIFE